jgi:predicted nicotinamide N-methyase
MAPRASHHVEQIEEDEDPLHGKWSRTALVESATISLRYLRQPTLADRGCSVHDLPQIYTRPSADELLSTLRSLLLTPTTFSEEFIKPLNISSTGLARYLTQIVSSPLSWLDEAPRESIWELASTRLAERSGRSAAPAMTRKFEVDAELTITLHEPSLTEDKLGLKTWSSSLVLARKLHDLEHLLPATALGDELRVLELGSGTGLVGIAAACMWSSAKRTTHVTLSDLPEIIPNLEKNLKSNQAVVDACLGRMNACSLDWGDEQNTPLREADRFPVIVAADPLYSPEHPALLVAIVGKWLTRDTSARFVVAVPLRDGYGSERKDMTQRLLDLGLEVEEQGEDSGFDDWEGADGQRQEVKYSWSVWKGTRKWYGSETSTFDVDINKVKT